MTSYQDVRLNEFISKAGFSNFNIAVSNGCGQNNFFGNVHKVLVEGTRNGVRTTEKLFIKTHGVDPERNKRVKIEDKFNREAFLYNEVIPEFEILQRDMPDECRVYFPKCFHADENCLVTEDLSEKSFGEIDEKSTLDAARVHAMMRDIAKFHSLSFALKLNKPERYSEFRNHLKYPNIPDPRRREYLIDKLWNWTVDALRDEDVKRRMIARKKDLLDESMIDSDSAVVCHGDYNLRNVLFGHTNKLVMIDFQLSYASSPVADILFALFSSTTSQLRRAEYKNFKNTYYESLERNISLLKRDINAIYPRRTFEADFRRHFRREFATVLMITRLMCIAFKDETDESKRKKSTILDYDSQTAENEFRRRINEVVNDFVYFEYL